MSSRSKSGGVVVGMLGVACSVVGCGDPYGENIDQVSQANQCGSTFDLQHVESYDGTLGVSRDFVDDHQSPVSTFAVLCSGTMISHNLLLTAGHCSVSVGDVARFNFQNDPSGNPRPTTDYTVGAVVEDRRGGLDYAIARLNPHPTLGEAGVAFGWTRIAKADPVATDTLAIIQHLVETPKKVEAGNVFSFSQSAILYGDLDTEGGASGAGILSAQRNAIVGVHTNGGCNPTGGANSGVRISSLLTQSPTLTNLSNQLSKNAGGFVWAQQATGSFPAADTYSWNMSGQANTITRVSQGRYRIDMPGQGGETGGNVQVTAYGAGTERCKVESWTSSGTTRQVFVRCFTRGGSPVNTLFTASFVGRTGVTGIDGGYLWADQATTTDYTPSIFFQYNSTGRGNSVHRNSTGNYTVRLRGQGFVGGTTEVTAYGPGTQHCKVEGWDPDADGQNVNVRCFNISGSPADSQFTMAFGLNSLHNTTSYTYAWANDPNPIGGTYTPDFRYQRGFIGDDFSPEGGHSTDTLVTITRTATGRYSVNLPEMTDAGGFFGKSNVKVTAYGSDAKSCKVVGWFGVTGGVQTDVACFSGSGVPSDSRFTITYSTTQFIIG